MKSRDPPVGHTRHLNNNFLLVCHVTHRWSYYVNKRAMLFRDQVCSNNNISINISEKKCSKRNGTVVQGTKNPKMHRGTQRVNFSLQNMKEINYDIKNLKAVGERITLKNDALEVEFLHPSRVDSMASTQIKYSNLATYSGRVWTRFKKIFNIKPFLTWQAKIDFSRPTPEVYSKRLLRILCFFCYHCSTLTQLYITNLVR